MASQEESEDELLNLANGILGEEQKLEADSIAQNGLDSLQHNYSFDFEVEEFGASTYRDDGIDFFDAMEGNPAFVASSDPKRVKVSMQPTDGSILDPFSPSVWHVRSGERAADATSTTDTLSLSSFDPKANDGDNDDTSDDGYAETQEELPEELKDEALQALDDLAKDFSALEVERSQFDVYGILPPAEENPAEIERKLEEMDTELSRLKHLSKNSIYLVAEKMDAEFVSSRRLRMSFLRSSGYEPVSAAKKLVHFLENKAELWGVDKVTRDIMISDFNEGTRGALLNGHIQILPSKDLSGRLIIFNNVNYLGGYEDGDDVLRLTWYMGQVAIEEEDQQRRGSIFIQCKVGPQRGSVTPQKKVLWKGLRIFSTSFPANVRCLHLCFNRSKLSLVRMFKYAGEGISSKVRVHEGTDHEIKQILSTYGILGSEIPVTDDGEKKLENHLEWIRKRILIENKREAIKKEREEAIKHAAELQLKKSMDHAMDDKSGSLADLGRMVIHPSKNDILMGRGKHNQMHPGNLRLRVVLEDHLGEYDDASKKGKKEIVRKVIGSLTESGARFLKPVDGGVWEIADEDRIRKKINHDFRTIRSIQKKKQESSTTEEPCKSSLLAKRTLEST